MTATIHHGDCLDVLRELPSNSIDAICCDPPYGLSNTTPEKVTDTIVRWAQGDREHVPTGKGFMGASWDAFVPPVAVWDECLRVLKPGGHLVAFAGSRTQDLMGLSIRLAGFDIRENVAWLYGSGFPKSLDVSKAIDKAAGAEREVVGQAPNGVKGLDRMNLAHGKRGKLYHEGATYGVTAPATDEAKKWEGWGTALKPGHEPIILARKPLPGTVAANVQEHGTGALNIDACRVATDDNTGRPCGKDLRGGNYGPNGSAKKSDLVTETHAQGRFPANVLLDTDQAGVLDQQSGNRPGAVSNGSKTQGGMNGTSTFKIRAREQKPGYADQGGASRFFHTVDPTEDLDARFLYSAKAPKKERPVVDGIAHPTVKPVALMRWLVRLTTQPGGTVLDPFAGSGTTVEAALNEGFNVIGIEREAEYLPLIQQRIDRANEKLPDA